MPDTTETPGNQKLTVKIHDEDDGTDAQLPARPQELLQTVVDAFYSDHLHRERAPGDRLRCDANGDDVFAHLAERLEAYRETHCRQLAWTFVGDTGGAAD